MSQHDKRIHNLVYGFDCDSLPAPSDVELAAADARSRRRRRTISVFTLFCQQWGIHICADREQFRAYIQAHHKGELGFDQLAELWMDFNKFLSSDWKREAIIAAEDARDLRETQQDALT